MKKKMAILSSGFVPNYIKYFLKLCKIHGIHVDLYCFDKKDMSEVSADNIYYIEEKPDNKNIKNIKRLDKILKNKIDTNIYDYILSDTLPLSFSCNVFHNVSTAFRMECAPFALYRWIFGIGHYKKIKHERNFYKNCPYTIAVSSVMKNDYVKNYKIDKDSIIIAHPGMSFVKDTKDLKIPKLSDNQIFTVGMSANGFVTKGGYLMLEAIYTLKKHYPDIKIKVKIINSRFKHNYILKLYLKLLKLDKMVEICAFQKNMESFYRSLNCFVCPSKYEAFGRVAPEAMNYKIPTIVSNNVGASDIIKDGENGFVFDANKNAAYNLALKIKFVHDNYKNLENLTENAHKTVQNITWDNFAKTIFYSLYPSFCKNENYINT